MAEYIFTYRCRYCGEKFATGITGSEPLATTFLIQTIRDSVKDAQHPGDLSLHYGENHIGVADLIGCKIKEND